MVVNEVNAWVFLIASLMLLLLICGLAALGLFTRDRGVEGKIRASCDRVVVSRDSG